MGEVYDVAVVGAGPAGATAALAARRADPDARVLLLDRADFPRDKTCGDGIAPHVFDVLDGLGATGVADGYPPIRWLHVLTPGGVRVRRQLPRPDRVIPRAVFDARIVAAAVAAGAELGRRRVRTLQLRAGLVVIDGEIAARTVVGADGATGVTRRLAGLPPVPAEATALAIRGYGPAPDTDEPEQWIGMVADGWPAYAWSFAIGDGRANVGFGKLVPRLRDGGGRRQLLAGLDALLPDAQPDPATVRAAPLPLTTGRARQPDGPVLLAGDAASLVNPLTGEGIFYAVLSGMLAGQAAARYRGQWAGAAYRDCMDARLGRHLRHTAWVSRAAQRSSLVDRAFEAAGRHDDVWRVGVELGLADGTVPAGLAARLVREWATSRPPGRRAGDPRRPPADPRSA